MVIKEHGLFKVWSKSLDQHKVMYHKYIGEVELLTISICKSYQIMKLHSQKQTEFTLDKLIVLNNRKPDCFNKSL